jgi:hypothetical protein
MKLVVIESPFAGATPEETERNITYARQCVKDCLMRGEAPLASHLLYTQPGILDDTIPEERQLGMRAGFAWNTLAELVVVYTDLDITDGMRKGIYLARTLGIDVEYRTLKK